MEENNSPKTRKIARYIDRGHPPSLGRAASNFSSRNGIDSLYGFKDDGKPVRELFRLLIVEDKGLMEYKRKGEKK